LRPERVSLCVAVHCAQQLGLATCTTSKSRDQSLDAYQIRDNKIQNVQAAKITLNERKSDTETRMQLLKTREPMNCGGPNGCVPSVFPCAWPFIVRSS
jgi:hypothetical protein